MICAPFITILLYVLFFATVANAAVSDFESPLPDGLQAAAPVAGFAVPAQSLLNRQYEEQGAVFGDIALVSLLSPSESRGECGIAGINADGALDPIATIRFNSIVPEDGFKPAATKSVRLRAGILAGGQNISVMVKAYGISGELLDTDSYNGTGDQHDIIRLEIRNSAGIHLVVVEQYQNDGGLIFDRLEFDDLAPAAIKVSATILSRSGTYRPGNERETLSVAVLGHSTFNVLEIDPSTFMYAGMGVRFEDGRYLEHIEDVNLDGYPDLILQIDSSDGGFDRDSLGLLSGCLFDGTPFEGAAVLQQ